MKKSKIFLICLCALALILEALPWGAVLNFSLDGGETLRKTYSYFDLTPFGYANFGPFISALLSVALSILCIIYLFKDKKGIKTAITVTAFCASASAIAPLAWGIRSFTVTGVLIFLTLLTAMLVSALIKPK